MEKIWQYVEKLEKQVSQKEEFNLKESWRSNVSVLINHHQDLEKMLSHVVRSSVNV